MLLCAFAALLALSFASLITGGITALAAAAENSHDVGLKAPSEIERARPSGYKPWPFPRIPNEARTRPHFAAVGEGRPEGTKKRDGTFGGVELVARKDIFVSPEIAEGL